MMWLAAALLALAGVLVVWIYGVCENQCPSTAGRLARGAVPIGLAWIFLAPSAALLLQARGRKVKTYGWPAGGIGAVLTLYALGVGLVAWWFGSDAIIVGDLAWVAYWVVAVAGWLMLGLALVYLILRR
jgi:hypothetical protein